MKKILVRKANKPINNKDMQKEVSIWGEYAFFDHKLPNTIPMHRMSKKSK